MQIFVIPIESLTFDLLMVTDRMELGVTLLGISEDSMTVFFSVVKKDF